MIDRIGGSGEMGKSEIYSNYQQAIRQAADLEDIAVKIDRLAGDRMGETINGLKGAWQSDNSSQFYSKIGQVQRDIHAQAQRARKVAGSIREIAKEIRDAELRALELAKRRWGNE